MHGQLSAGLSVSIVMGSTITQRHAAFKFCGDTGPANVILSFSLAHAACCLVSAVQVRTRKLCYRKDDRAMRPICRCPENFRESLTTSTPSCLQNFNGFLLGLSLQMFRPNLKFIALSVPAVIGGTQNIGQSQYSASRGKNEPTKICHVELV